MKVKKAKAKTSTEKRTGTIDVHIGRKIRQRRVLLGITQEKLADALGVTFQQVQKYEHGANRVSASRLWQLSIVLETSINYFFEGMTKQTAKNHPVNERQETLAEDKAFSGFDPMDRKETMDLVRNYYAISNPTVAKTVRKLLKTLSMEGDVIVEDTEE